MPLRNLERIADGWVDPAPIGWIQRDSQQGEAIVEKVVEYLEAIEAINRAERQLSRALEAAQSAWASVPPNLREKLSPPPICPVDD
jgi:hypothetical protein